MCLMILVYLFTCYYYYLVIIIILHNTRTHGHKPASCAHAKDEGRTKCSGQSSRVSRPSQHIRPIRPPSAPMHGENLAAGLPWLLMIRAFSTRHPAMAFIPGARLICHWLPPAFVPTMFRPLSCSSEATNQHQRALYGGLMIYLRHVSLRRRRP